MIHEWYRIGTINLIVSEFVQVHVTEGRLVWRFYEGTGISVIWILGAGSPVKVRA